MSLLAKAPKNVVARLEWLRKVLTQPDVDTKLNHRERQLLTEHVEELLTDVVTEEEDSLA